MIPPKEGLERLIEGNREFMAGTPSPEALLRFSRGPELPQEQFPFAIILGCSDARVPAEIIFNQGLGDLFVIRVAGNIVSPSQIGSVEFAAERFGTPLVVVLGHTQCGAILATLQDLLDPADDHSQNLLSIVERVRPAVEPLLKTDLRHDHTELVHQAVRSNVRASVSQLQHGSDILEKLIQSGKLMVVGAEYSLETGVVDFFDGV